MFKMLVGWFIKGLGYGACATGALLSTFAGLCIVALLASLIGAMAHMCAGKRKVEVQNEE